MKKPVIIVFGNAKGGTGKSTLCFHFYIRLIKLGFKVAAIDCDVNQGTMSRYILNRLTSIKKGQNLPIGYHSVLKRSVLKEYEFSSLSELSSFFGEDSDNLDGSLQLEQTLKKYSNCDFIVIDTPGSIDNLFFTAHSYADVVITPINDSLIDLDLIGDLGDSVDQNVRMGVYSEILWEAKKKKAIKSLIPIIWVVLKNRMIGSSSANSDNINYLLSSLSKKLGFHISNGMCERLLFRELFKDGKTVFDDDSTSLSYVVARSEVDYLVKDVFNMIKKSSILMNG